MPWLNFLREKVADKVYYRLALFMILTGCRVGEAAGLCWDAVQLNAEKPFIKIIRTRNWIAKSGQEKIRSRVKTKNARRTINLPKILVGELKKIKIIEIEGEKPVFYKSGGTLFTVRTIHNHFNKAFKHLNLPWKGTHIARHTSGTLALIASKDLAVVQAMLGHSNVTQTQEYAKVIALQDNFAPHKTAELLGL
ncbi:MAG: site-specific integrase [Oligoflexales bacterium]